MRNPHDVLQRQIIQKGNWQRNEKGREGGKEGGQQKNKVKMLEVKFELNINGVIASTVACGNVDTDAA